MNQQVFQVTHEQAGKTLAAVLRIHLPEFSWSKVRRLIKGRRIHVGEYLCMDEARRLKENDTITVLRQAAPRPPEADSIDILHLDADIIVVNKPALLPTNRHHTERNWSKRRKRLTPTLEDLVTKKILRREKRKSMPRLRLVHRLDKQTSGLLVLARTVLAERGLGKQFHDHSVHRRYVAIIPGFLPRQTIETYLVRDRGDGRRGSTAIPGKGKKAITHIDVLKRWKDYTMLSCRLETGRTHQIRIHLAEKGHPVCGESVYHRRPDGNIIADASGTPRLALHASELGFYHPISGKALRWSANLPADLRSFINSLESSNLH